MTLAVIAPPLSIVSRFSAFAPRSAKARLPKSKFRRPASVARLSLFFVTMFRFLAFGQETTPQAGAAGGSPLAQANPGRPTISTPSTLTSVGYLQLESGVLGAEKSGEFSNRTGIETVVKLSLIRRFELILQTEPMVFSDLGNRNDQRPGEVFAGFQTVLKPGDGSRPTVSVSYF